MSYVKSYRKIPNQWNHKIFKLGNVSGKQIEEEERRSLTVIVTVGTVIGCSAKTKFCQMAPKSTENH